jgi:CheY-like chemotaxis protein
VGTQFTLTLDRAFQETHGNNATKANPLIDKFPHHVLLIDDERHVRLGLRMLLEEIGCTCSEAGTIDEALVEARRQRPDIILADLRLRGTETGINAIAQLRSEGGPIPALLISGDTAPDRLQEALHAGVLLLHKPLSVHVLRQEIYRAIHQG